MADGTGVGRELIDPDRDRGMIRIIAMVPVQPYGCAMQARTDDQKYASARAFEEREAAAQASCLARAAHEELAELHEAVAAGETVAQASSNPLREPVPERSGRD